MRESLVGEPMAINVWLFQQIAGRGSREFPAAGGATGAARASGRHFTPITSAAPIMQISS